MDTATRIQFLDEAVCISHSANTIGRGMAPNFLLPAKDKIVGQTKLFNFGITTDLGEGKP